MHLQEVKVASTVHSHVGEASDVQTRQARPRPTLLGGFGVWRPLLPDTGQESCYLRSRLRVGSREGDHSER